MPSKHIQSRREVVKRLSIALSGWVLTPTLLSACDEDEDNFAKFTGKVLIVGAGAAGLYAGQLLLERGIDVEILEASSQLGGRIKELQTFADYPIELGAEEIHGNNSTWYRAVQQMGGQFKTTPTTDYVLLDGILRTEEQCNTDADFVSMEAVVDSLEESEPSEIPDVSVSTFGVQKTVKNRVQHVFNARLGNEYGTDNDTISARGIADGQSRWTAGDANYGVQNKSLRELLIALCPLAVAKTKLGVEVKDITYSPSGVGITDKRRNSYIADRCLVTVSLGVLRSGKISFNPALPSSKVDSMPRIGMGPGMKVVLKFASRFWQADLGSLFIPGIIPEFWSPSTGRSGNSYWLTAFVHGASAATLSAQGNGAIDTILDQLETAYGANTARPLLIEAIIEDWSKNEFVLGTYSYPLVGGDGAREQLALPVGKSLYFAGEATHTNGHFATVHGAIETAERAVNEIIRL